MKEIKATKIEKEMKISDLVEKMGDMGFGAKKISQSAELIKRMFDDETCKVFLGIAGAMVPAGMKQIIIDLLDNTDVLVTTGANLTHDLMEALGEKHYHGDETIDDATLNEQGIDRIYNVFMKNSVYEKLEDFFEEHYDKFKVCKNTKEFLWKLGELVPEKSNSILRKCYDKKIPVFCPGIADSGIGLMMWGRDVAGKGESEAKVFADMKEIIDFAWTAEKSGVIYVGGGLPKNFIQQSLQFAKGASYGVQITTDRIEPGGSSGAPLREGISWGKMNKDANFVDVFCDATIALPLIYGYVKDNLK